MQTSKMRLSLRMLALVAVGYLGWVAVQSFLPAPGPAEVSVTLLGYTNATLGSRLAVFAVTNIGPSEVLVFAHGIFTTNDASEPGTLIGYSPAGYGWHSILNRNESGRFSVPPPTNHSSWKMSVGACNDVRIDQVIQRFWTRPRLPAFFESDWIKAVN
jgi:hypothetical protein